MSDLNPVPRSYAPERYALSGKIMLSAIVILFSVVILIICLHIYARWFLARSRRRQQLLNRSRRRRAHIIFTSDIPSGTVSHGLDAALLKSLPTFVYTSKTDEEVVECAVCLSEFEENEKGRLLPMCNHSFHTGCIDMWFHSHSTCPLCRSPVDSTEILEPKTEDATQIEIVVQPVEESSNPVEEQMECPPSSSGSTSSDFPLGSRRKCFQLMGVSIEVPRRNESFKNTDEETPKSPGGRILSLKRMLSRASRPSTPLSCTSYPAIEVDLERGGDGGGVKEDEEEVRAATPANQTTTSWGPLPVGP